MIKLKKYIHVMHNDKFIAPYIEFINEYFNSKEHLFLIVGGVNKKEIPILNLENVKVYNYDKYIKVRIIEKLVMFLWLLYYCFLGQKIFFHSLINYRFVPFLYRFKFLLKKSYWIIWGADLYSYLERDNTKLKKVKKYLKEDFVKKNFKGYITEFRGDYELAQKWYGAVGKYYDCFMYPSNLYKEFLVKPKVKTFISILVGNSADPSNNHLEIFDKLKKYKEDNIKIYCILSYGNKDYANNIEKRGKEIFSEKFYPIKDFMKYDEYLEFLSEIDIAIFAHNRQQAFGNITSLLSMKKTIYLKEEVTTFIMLEKIGVRIKSFNKLEELEKLDEKTLENNKKIIEKNFSKIELIKEWKEIFEDI